MSMNIQLINSNQWDSIESIYMEAFPKHERKPFRSIQKSVNKKRAQLFVATEANEVLGFILCFIKDNLVLVDYLAVNQNIRGKGTGSKLIQYIKDIYTNHKIVLLIEQVVESASNYTQRIARKKFYLTNGFNSSSLFIDGSSGVMEILNYGSKISGKEFLSIYKFALSPLYYYLSKVKLITQ